MCLILDPGGEFGPSYKIQVQDPVLELRSHTRSRPKDSKLKKRKIQGEITSFFVTQFQRISQDFPWY